MSGPATGRRKRGTALRALLACLGLVSFDVPHLHAQTVASDLLRPVPDGFLAPRNSPLRKTSENLADKTADGTGDDQSHASNRPAPSRIGNIPTYGLPAASGASDAGFDSLNRTRRRRPAPSTASRRANA